MTSEIVYGYSSKLHSRIKMGITIAPIIDLRSTYFTLRTTLLVRSTP